MTDDELQFSLLWQSVVLQVMIRTVCRFLNDDSESVAFGG